MITAHQKRQFETYEKALLDVRKMVNEGEPSVLLWRVCGNIVSEALKKGKPTLFHTCAICGDGVREDFLNANNVCNVCDSSIRG